MLSLLEKSVNLFNEAKFEEALEVNDQLIANSPNTPHYHFNRAMILGELDRVQEACDSFAKARDLKPDCPVLRYFMSDILLRLGRFKEGFTEKEWRFKDPLPDSHMPNPVVFGLLPKVRKMYKQPDWDGESDIAGKTIAVFNEAGFGDAIMNLRYLQKIKERGANVILEVKTNLYRIFKNSAGIDQLVKRDKMDKMPAWFSTFSNQGSICIDLPPHDYAMSINSMCYFFDHELKETPTENYIFLDRNEPENKAVEVIKEFKDKFKIGIVWAGNDKDYHDCFRSCYLRQFKPISDIDNVKLFSLQKGKMIRRWLFDMNKNSFATVNLLDNSEGVDYIDLSGYINDFHDTAEMINALDLVITIDTSVAHLVGAMGKPVWMICSTPNHDWRWQHKWYPSMTIFQQPSKGNWDELFQEVTKKIRKFT